MPTLGGDVGVMICFHKSTLMCGMQYVSKMNMRYFTKMNGYEMDAELYEYAKSKLIFLRTVHHSN